ncbi:phosphoribosylglycinamide formyltransferase [Christiangramia forsetii]|uniref:Phosphoribosylglycinamide formyltransferase n=2 Tax=Christiangramia forsetii TaxID=411153 RepID=A0M6S6_CHRFK|nr:phosphoribosylglycinamide formyltransferase [Christiangramia forsetii]GGG29664.1 phosphoribosylglycinamide formyltransferase [Christiangramia forsetii]CAL68321.1 phosphoribosylglycinamide formyltransferase [Christiangramia forsetii KT0803]
MSDKESTNTKKIVIFASGSGTNAENIIKYFQKSKNIEVVAVLSNRRSAGVLKRAHDLNVKALLFDKEALYHTNDVLNILKDIDPDLIVLAGFLWLFPSNIIEEFPDKIINIHPALLPKYGGKGMYGNKVHETIIAEKETESGITIHFVNEKYDEGNTIFQATTSIENHDTAESLAGKIHELEYKHFPEVIQQILEDNN